MLLILMSNDIHLNPGPQPLFQNNFFKSMNWNLNSLTKENFHRVDLIEAHKNSGVGLFYKNSLPTNVRRDLSIVVEFKFGRKNIFFTVLYRSPSFNHASPEFQAFLLNFKNLYPKIKTENPFAMFLLEILTVNSIAGGPMVTKLQKAVQLKLCLLPLVCLS